MPIVALDYDYYDSTTRCRTHCTYRTSAPEHGRTYPSQWRGAFLLNISVQCVMLPCEFSRREFQLLVSAGYLLARPWHRKYHRFHYACRYVVHHAIPSCTVLAARWSQSTLQSSDLNESIRVLISVTLTTGITVIIILTLLTGLTRRHMTPIRV